MNEELIGEINEFQKDCIKSYELNDNIKEKYKHTIKELDLFVEKILELKAFDKKQTNY